MDRKDEIIQLQMDVINQMTRSNLSRIADDLWGAPVPAPKAEVEEQKEKHPDSLKESGCPHVNMDNYRARSTLPLRRQRVQTFM